MKMALPGHPLVGINARVSLSAYSRSGSFLLPSLMNRDRPHNPVMGTAETAGKYDTSPDDGFERVNK